MSRKFNRRPYELLFPSIQNPVTQLAIDMIVFQIGYEIEQKNEIEKLKLQAGVAAMRGALR